MLKKVLLALAWASSVSYLYAGNGTSGFGYQGDYRLLALVSLVVCTVLMIDRENRFLQAIKRMLRLRSPFVECD
jgi:hypothetical protein